MEAFTKVLQSAIDLIEEAAAAPRAEVVRTSHTEERDPISPLVRHAVLRRDKYRCVWCGSRHGLQMDHVIPWSAGGPDTIDNLRALCGECNERRSNRMSMLDTAGQLPRAHWCTRCASTPRLDDMRTVWCRECGARGVGYPAEIGGAA